MSKEKVFIVLSHKNSLKKGSKTEWEVTETIEFVNQLRNKHTSMSSAVCDYLDEKMITGSRIGMGDYTKFNEYICSKYEKQLTELDAAYKPKKEVPQLDQEQIFKNNTTQRLTDAYGNTRAPTVFDL
jgi:hypothetical protein